MAKVLSAVGILLSLSLWVASGSAQETELLPDPGTAEMADRAKIKWGTLGMTSCTNKETMSGNANIVCFFVLTQSRYEESDFPVEKLMYWKPRLIDNLGIEHEFITLYLLNRRGQQQETVNLAKGESVWFVAEFEGGGENEVTGVRVLFNAPGRPHLSAPVKATE